MKKQEIKFLKLESIRKLIHKEMIKKEKEEVYENKFFDIETAFTELEE